MRQVAANSVDINTKLNYVIKTFLYAHKGKRFTGTMIADFINGNHIVGRHTHITPASINKRVKAAQGTRGILSEVNLERDAKQHRTYYWVE